MYSQESRELLGGKIEIYWGDEDIEGGRAAMRRAFSACEQFEKSFSRFIEGNELWELNQRVGEWQRPSSELLDLLKSGEDLRTRTQGAFDITVQSILEGWGYDKDYSLQEGEAGALGEVEFRDDEVKISAPVDLGGLGKGYALDLMVSEMKEVDNFLVNASGDIYARGRAEEGGAWRAYFEHPFNLEQAIGFVEVDGFAIACSNPQRRKWRDRHHLVNPVTGEPAGKMAAVYTQAESGMLADAYATALFALGYQGAKKLLPELPVEAMLVSPEGAVFRSEAFKGELFTSE